MKHRNAPCTARFVVMMVGICLAGCHQAPEAGASDPDEKTAAADAHEAPGEFSGVVVDDESMQRLGVELAAVAGSSSVATTRGTAVVLDSTVLTVALAEIDAVRFETSTARGNFERLQRLFADDGNASRQAVEAAQAQWVAARARLAALEARVRSDWGPQFVDAQGSRPSWFEELAEGRAVLLRADFVGALPADAGQLDYALLGPESRVGAMQRVVFVGRSRAPALAAVGAGLVLRSKATANSESALRPGERLPVIAMSRSGPTRPLVPAAAAIADAGQFWCYVQRAGGRFDRVPLPSIERVADGYPAPAGIKVGDQVVVRGAPLLLSLERGSGTVADEE